MGWDLGEGGVGAGHEMLGRLEFDGKAKRAAGSDRPAWQCGCAL